MLRDDGVTPFYLAYGLLSESLDWLSSESGIHTSAREALSRRDFSLDLTASSRSGCTLLGVLGA